MTNKQIDFEGLGNRLLQNAPALLEKWLPEGKWHGNEYQVGSLQGEPGDSLSINSKTGLWSDFATREGGRDLISLFAAIHGLNQVQAAEELLGDTTLPPVGAGSTKKNAPKDHEIIPAPMSAGTPSMHHRTYGEPERAWCYKAKTGQVLFWVARYAKDGGKSIAPWSWSKTESRWVMKSFPKPRTLYNLHRLTKDTKRVLIVEGEKAADAAQELLGKHYLVMTWAGGSKAIGVTDWTALHGKTVLLWPDADRKAAKTQQEANKYGVQVGDILPYRVQPGPAAMISIAEEIVEYAKRVKILDVGIDHDRPDGWDAADALDNGWTTESTIAWAQPRARDFEQEKADVINLEIEKAKAELPPDLVEENLNMWQMYDIYGLNIEGKKPSPNEDNVARILEQHKPYAGLIWYDEFYQRFFTTDPVTKKPREWADLDNVKFTRRLQSEFGMSNLRARTAENALMIYGQENAQNALKSWLTSLKWDGTDRIEHFFADCMGSAKTDYVRSVSKNFFIMLVARALRPGCKVDNMVVFQGSQGLFKTSAFESLVGQELYMESAESVTKKDFYISIQGKWLVEVAELDSFSKADVTNIKRVVSARNDRYRGVWERNASDHPRQCVFVGTTNEFAFLRDPTGNRRYWPIKISNALDVDMILDMREQLFAEAVHRFNKNETWWETPRDETLEIQEQHREYDEWENRFEEWLVGYQRITLGEVLKHAVQVPVEKQDKLIQRRAGSIMHSLGWERSTIREGSKTLRGWKRVVPGGQSELPLTDEGDELP